MSRRAVTVGSLTNGLMTLHELNRAGDFAIILPVLGVTRHQV